MPAVNNDFLPQYAAQAVIDFENRVKQFARTKITDYTPQEYQTAQRQAATTNDIAQLIRQAAKVVLPANGEVYRANGRIASPVEPTAEELHSLAWMPAPVTSFEFPFENPREEVDFDIGRIAAPRRIVLVVDGRQQFGQSETSFALQFISIIYSEQFKAWGYHRNSLLLKCPVSMNGLVWTPLCHELDVEAGLERSGNFLEWLPDLTAVIQACHALQLGAELTPRVESSSSRRYKFDHRGAGSFLYHVMSRVDSSFGLTGELASLQVGAPHVCLGTPARLPQSSLLIREIANIRPA